MKKIKLTTLLLVLTLLSLNVSKIVNAQTGTVRITNVDLVNYDGYMDFVYNTKYDSFIFGGQSLWNQYFGKNVIRETTDEEMINCYIEDVDFDDVTWVGLTTIIPGDIIPGTIELNDHFLRGYSTTKILSAIKHEFGHTLGCDENTCSDLNIMYPYLRSNINLTIHDKASVDEARKHW